MKGLRKITWDLKELTTWLRLRGHNRIVLTNGCFDVLHAGHVALIEAARYHGEFLIVLLNNDESIRQLKGPGRPVNRAINRALVLAALEDVGYVFVFEGTKIDGLIAEIKPNVWVKGGDYTLKTLDKAEVAAARKVKCQIKIVPLLPDISTTKIYEEIRKMDQDHCHDGRRRQLKENSGKVRKRL